MSNLARDVTRHLGGDWLGHYGLAPGPGHSKKDRSLKIKPHPSDTGEIVLYSFAGDGWKDLKDELRRAGVLPAKDFRGARPLDPAEAKIAAARREEAAAARLAEDEAAAARQLEISRWLWERGEPAGGTVVEVYLRSRGIVLDDLPRTLRYLPPDPQKYPFPAMMAAFGMAVEREPGKLFIPLPRIQGVHLTYLTADGQGKALIEKQRKMIGPSNGWPICLAPPNDGLGLFIGEGIETALWGHQATGLGCWAAGDAGRLPGLANEELCRIPTYIEAVTIAEDADPAGMRFTSQLAQGLKNRGFEAIVVRCCHGA